MKKSLARNPAPEGGATLPTAISRAKFAEALRPILAQAGATPEGILAEGFRVTEDSIAFRSVVPIAGVEPEVSSADSEVAIWVWPIEIQVGTP